jgi:hypothetical protein
VVFVKLQDKTNYRKRETIMTPYWGIDPHHGHSVIGVLDE